jgi:hypothetical protein
MAANRDRLRNILLVILATVTLGTAAFLLWGEVEFESARSDVRDLCHKLKLQDPLAQVQVTVGVTPNVSLLLMDASEDGVQSGSVYSEAAPGVACSVTFQRGRLTQKSFGGGRAPSTPGAPGEKLKTW